MICVDRMLTQGHGDFDEGWEPWPGPRFLSETRTGKCVFRPPLGQASYVNGIPVVAQAVLSAGDVVRVFGRGEEDVVLRFNACKGLVEVEVTDQVCALTGDSIEGRALRCPGCGAHFSLAVPSDQCPCCEKPDEAGTRQWGIAG